MTNPKKGNSPKAAKTKASERLVDGSGYFLRGPYMGETDEAMIAMMQHHERVLRARSHDGKYFPESEQVLAEWGEHKRLAEERLDGDFFVTLGKALNALRSAQNRHLTDPRVHSEQVLLMPDFGADVSESTICETAASVACNLRLSLGRLPTEAEVRKETRIDLARRHAQIVQFTQLRKEATEGTAPNPRTLGEQKELEQKRHAELKKLTEAALKDLRDKDSKYRGINWRRIFDRIAKR